MKIAPKLMSACVRDFKSFGTVTWPLLMRRHKVGLELAKEICVEIERRFPNLWRNRHENHLKKIKGLNRMN